MAIVKDKIQTSIRFSYENEAHPEHNYTVIFEQTDLGPTVSLTQDGQSFADFPADLFTDIADLLRSKKLVDPPQLQQMAVASGLVIPNIRKKNPATDEVEITDSGRHIQSFTSSRIIAKTEVPVQQDAEQVSVEGPVVIDTENTSIEIIDRPIKKSGAATLFNSQRAIKRRDTGETE